MVLGSGIRDPGSGTEIRDPVSGKNLFRIPDPGSRCQKGTGSRIRIRNTEEKYGFCFYVGELKHVKIIKKYEKNYEQ